MSPDARYGTESMLLPTSTDRRLEMPERQLLDAIASGELDDHLVAVSDAIHARQPGGGRLALGRAVHPGLGGPLGCPRGAHRRRHRPLEDDQDLLGASKSTLALDAAPASVGHSGEEKPSWLVVIR